MEAILGLITGWEQVVVIGLFLLFQYLSNRHTDHKVAKVQETLTQNNGGNSVKDRFDRLESKMDEHFTWAEDQAARIEALEAAERARINAQSDDQQPSGLLARLFKL